MKAQDVVIAECSHHPLWTPEIGDSITWECCAACGHWQTNGYFETIPHKANASQVPGYMVEQQRFSNIRIVESVREFVPHGKWLDIGFGAGNLLLTASEYGYDVAGVETRQQCVDGIREMGIAAYASLDEAPTASVVSLCDIIEHIPFPLPFLASAAEKVEPGGVMVVATPNRDAPLWSYLNKTNGNPYWAEIEHFHIFGKQQLTEAIRALGFAKVEYFISGNYRCGMTLICQK